MTSSNTRYHVWGCLTATADAPVLEHYFEDRAAELVRSLAKAIVDQGPQVTTREGFRAFCENAGIDPDSTNMKDRPYHEILSRALDGVHGDPWVERTAWEEIAREGTGQDDRVAALVPVLVQDYSLLEQWILARKDPRYLTILFGSCRPVPWFETVLGSDEGACPSGSDETTAAPRGFPVDEYLSGRIARDLPEAPLEGILVDDGRTLRIAPSAVLANRARRVSLLEQFRGYYLWILVFTT